MTFHKTKSNVEVTQIGILCTRKSNIEEKDKCFLEELETNIKLYNTIIYATHFAVTVARNDNLPSRFPRKYQVSVSHKSYRIR